MTFLFLAAIATAVAFGVTVLATPVVRKVALARSWTDTPDGTRKLHDRATPSAGGLAIFAGVATATGLAALALPQFGLKGLGLSPLVVVGGLIVVSLGAVDDIRGLGFKMKLTVEVIVAYMLLHADLRVDLSGLPFVGNDIYVDALYSIPITVLWIVGVMNAVNLVDGIDGLASGVAAIAFASMALAYGLAGDLPLVLVAVVFVGALVGFLVHNFNPASIFMGDSGSLFLGYALAVYTLSGPHHAQSFVAPILPLLALGLPLLDTSLSMVRRVASRKAIMAPDHDHIHHRMTGLMSTRKAVGTLYAVSATFGLLGVAASTARGTGALLIAVACAGAVAAGLLVRLGYVRLPYAAPRLNESLSPSALAAATFVPVARPRPAEAPAPAAPAPEALPPETATDERRESLYGDGASDEARLMSPPSPPSARFTEEISR